MNIGAIMATLGFTLPLIGVELAATIYDILQLGRIGLAVIFGLLYRITKPKPR